MADLVAIICVLPENVECLCVSANNSLFDPSDSILEEAIDINNVTSDGDISEGITVVVVVVVVVVEVCNVCS